MEKVSLHSDDLLGVSSNPHDHLASRFNLVDRIYVDLCDSSEPFRGMASGRTDGREK
jgi:hypothetical protein